MKRYWKNGLCMFGIGLLLCGCLVSCGTEMSPQNETSSPMSGSTEAVTTEEKQPIDMVPIANMGGHTVSSDLLWKNCPSEEIGNYAYLLDVIDWDLNVDSDLHKNRFMRPIPVRPVEEMEKKGYVEEWICYKNPLVSAK